MRLTPLVVFLLLFFNSVSDGFSQKKDAESSLKGKGTVFIELLGNTGLYSLNYDRVFYHKKRDALTWRAGLAYWPLGKDIINTGTMTFLGEFNYLRGKGPHFLESGVGLTHWWIFRLDDDTYVRNYLLTRIGYRYQKAKGGFFFRIGVLPVVYLERNVDPIGTLYGGVSLGYTFKFSGKKSGRRENSDGPKP